MFDLVEESGQERSQYIIIVFGNNDFKDQLYDAIAFNMMNMTECYCKIVSKFSNKYNEVFTEIKNSNAV